MRSWFFLASIVCVAVGCDRADDPVRVYSVPKEKHQVVVAPASPAAGVESPSESSGPMTWTAPADWVQQDPKPMRLVSFTAGKSEVIVTVLPSGAGSLIDNINRWRGQVELASVKDAAEQTKTSSKLAGSEASTYDFVGPAKRQTVTIIHRGEQEFFVKIIGPADDVARQMDGFNKFLESIRFSK